MPPKAIRQAGVAVLTLAGILGACDKDPPTAPTPSGGTPQGGPFPGPPPTTQPGEMRLELAGPASVPPGETAQYTVIASYADGSTRDVTTESTWRVQPYCCPVSSSVVLTVSPGGAATGISLGEASLYASFDGRSSQRTVLVLPAGTFRQHGYVFDGAGEAPAGPAGPVAVSGAQAAVSHGFAVGLAATTDSSGKYRLYGVSGDTEIRVTKPGYVEQRKRLTVSSNNQGLVFNLALSSARQG